jgi:hypothetical protein
LGGINHNQPQGRTAYPDQVDILASEAPDGFLFYRQAQLHLQYWQIQSVTIACRSSHWIVKMIAWGAARPAVTIHNSPKTN